MNFASSTYSQLFETFSGDIVAGLILGFCVTIILLIFRAIFYD